MVINEANYINLRKILSQKMNTTAVKPKRWKLMLVSWLFVYPVINLMFALVFPLVKNQHQLIKTLVFTLILVPLMGVCIPWLHKKYWSWIVK